MTTKPATPLPWDTAGSTPQQATIDKGNFCIGDCGSGVGAHQNAAYIVRACNAYPQLVAALRKYLATAGHPLGIAELADIDAEARALLRSLGEAQ